MSTEAAKRRPPAPTEPGAADSPEPTKAAAARTEAEAEPLRRFTPEQQKAWLSVMMEGVKLMGTKGVARRVSALVPGSAGSTQHTPSRFLLDSQRKVFGAQVARARRAGVAACCGICRHTRLDVGCSAAIPKRKGWNLAACTPALTWCAVASTHVPQDEQRVQAEAAAKIKEANKSLEEVVDGMVAAWQEAHSLGFRSVPLSMHHTPRTVCPTARSLAAVLVAHARVCVERPRLRCGVRSPSTAPHWRTRAMPPIWCTLQRVAHRLPPAEPRRSPPNSTLRRWGRAGGAGRGGWGTAAASESITR